MTHERRKRRHRYAKHIQDEKAAEEYKSNWILGGIAVACVLILIIVISVVTTLPGSTPESRPASTIPGTLAPTDVCIPAAPGNPFGEYARKAGFVNNRIFVPTFNGILNAYADGFTVAYWQRLPNYVFSTETDLKVFCRRDPNGLLYQIVMTATPASAGDTSLATLTFKIIFLNTGTTLDGSYSTPVDLTQWLFLAYTITADQSVPPDPDTGILNYPVTGATFYVNGEQVDMTRLVSVSSDLFMNASDTTSLNLGAYDSSDGDDPTTDVKLLTWYNRPVVFDDIQLIYADATSNNFARSIPQCQGAWNLGQDDTSYVAFYSKLFPPCITGVLQGDVVILPLDTA